MFRELSVTDPIPLKQAREEVVRQASREVIAGLRNPWAASFALEMVADWNWKADVEGLYILSNLNDDLYLYGGRPVAELTSDLVDTFAELAMPTNAEKRNYTFGLLESQG
jgi:hypothetical protein